MKNLYRALKITVKTFLDKNLPNTFFFWFGGWKAFLHGRCISIQKPALMSIEYFHQYMPKKGDVIFDIGGEYGVETGIFSSLVGANGSVNVLECLPNHIAYLENKFAEVENVSLIKKAAWNKKQKLIFYIGETAGSSTAVKEAKGQRGQDLVKEKSERIEVEADTLDTIWKEDLNSVPIDFLKMDIEGAEYEALEEAAELLKCTKHVAIAAYHIRDGVIFYHKMLEFSHGYDLV